LAYVTELTGEDVAPALPALEGVGLTSEYAWRAHRGRQYRLGQMASVIPKVLHSQPDHEAARLVAYAADVGFEAIRKMNRDHWAELWRGRINIIGAEAKWQALADAAFYYLMTSTHPSSPASTSIFGLATWHDYHYYYGHVMWDIEMFCVPPLIFRQPAAAASMLEYRTKTLDAARSNAQLMGRRGLQFAWESAPSTGQEAAPIPGTAAWREDHVSLDVARAFSLTRTWRARSDSCRRRLGRCLPAYATG
jgi:trehalose/maltose hydrolase-like predicted phosphorylase